MNTKETFVIQGLAGAKTLKGTVTIKGAKNAALKAMAAAILFDGQVTLENVPDNNDIQTLTDILRKLGARVEKTKHGGRSTENEDGETLTINATEVDANSINSTVIDADLAKSMRASVVLTGPMLGRYKKVSFPAPGGCVIGARPIDLFLSGYEKIGATVNEHDCIYDISANKGLQGTEISFKKISVGATETLMMAAVLANGKTVLKNCAMEPEIGNVAEWLNDSGAKISGIGTPTLTIEGTNGKLLSAKKSFVTIPDRITAGSFLILGALCTEELTIKNCRPDHMEAIVQLLTDSGVKMKIGGDFITVYGEGNDAANSGQVVTKNSTYKSIPNLRTHEYPGFPTDLQSPLVTFLTQSTGESIILETIFEGRFKYVEELIKLGANIITMNPHEIMVKGPTIFHQLPDDEELTAHDIRAGFAVVLAALTGKGKFVINNVHLIDRGYEKLDEVLRNLGANVERVRR